MARAIILVIDGFGLGHAPDADQFGDIGANSFLHIAQRFEAEKKRKLSLPNLTKNWLG